MGVKRVVFTSSYGAVLMDPYRSPDQTVDESCWSHLNFCKQTKNLYCYARTAAERTATEESSRRGIQLVALVPAVTIGEMLHPTLSVSTAMVARYMTGAKTTFPDAVDAYVDVQDVARAHVLVYEDTASSGRYLCVADVLHRSEVLRMMRCVDAKPKVKPFKFSAQRLQDLGMKFTPLKESLYRTMICLQGKGHVPILLSHSGIGQHLKVE